MARRHPPGEGRGCQQHVEDTDPGAEVGRCGRQPGERAGVVALQRQVPVGAALADCGGGRVGGPPGSLRPPGPAVEQGGGHALEPLVEARHVAAHEIENAGDHAGRRRREHPAEVGLAHQARHVDLADQPVDVDPLDELLDVDAGDQRLDVDPPGDLVDVHPFDDLLDVHPFDDRLDVHAPHDGIHVGSRNELVHIDPGEDRRQVDAFEDLVHVDGGDDELHHPLRHGLGELFDGVGQPTLEHLPGVEGGHLVGTVPGATAPGRRDPRLRRPAPRRARYAAPRRCSCPGSWPPARACPRRRPVPPRSPPSGPRSMIQSADLITSRLCSMTTTVLPWSTRRRSTPSSLRTSSKCSPVVGSSRM